MSTQNLTVTTTWQNIFNIKLEAYYGLQIKENNGPFGSIIFLENGDSSSKEVTIFDTRGIKIDGFSMNLPVLFFFENYPSRVFEIQKTVDEYLQIRISSGTDVLVNFRLFSDIPNKSIVFNPRQNSTNKDTFFRLGIFSIPKIESGSLNVISWKEGAATSYTIRLLNIQDNTILLESTLTNTTETVNNLGNLTNIPDNSFRCELLIKRNGGNNSSKVYIESLTLNYI
jgi:hypothetical protein